MENVTEAFLMAFAVFIFAAALTVSIAAFSKVRAVSDAVVRRTDEYVEQTEQARNEKAYRIVGMETIIPVLYRYYKDETTVVFLEGARIDNAVPEGVDLSGVRRVTYLSNYRFKFSWTTGFKNMGYKLLSKRIY